MATKNMAYDHPAYTAVLPVSLGLNAAGANAILSGRFTAFTDTLIKSVTAAVVTAGTSTSHVVRLLIYRGGTSTATGILGTLVSSGFFNALATGAFGTMTQGDSMAVLLSSDATQVVQAGAELVIAPGANVTS